MILGIDPSLSATGIAALDGKVQLSTIHSKPGEPVARLLEITRQVNAVLDLVRPVAVGIEGLSMGSNDPSAQERAALHYFIRAALHLRGIPCYVIAPMSLKKFVCGKATVANDAGRQVPAGKEHMLKAVWRNWEIDTADNNQADAAGLAYVVAAITGRYEMTNVAQREVVAKLTAAPVVKVKRRKGA